MEQVSIVVVEVVVEEAEGAGVEVVQLMVAEKHRHEMRSENESMAMSVWSGQGDLHLIRDDRKLKKVGMVDLSEKADCSRYSNSSWMNGGCYCVMIDN